MPFHAVLCPLHGADGPEDGGEGYVCIAADAALIQLHNVAAAAAGFASRQAAGDVGAVFKDRESEVVPEDAHRSGVMSPSRLRPSLSGALFCENEGATSGCRPALTCENGGSSFRKQTGWMEKMPGSKTRTCFHFLNTGFSP